MRNENHFSYSGEAIAREKKTNLQAFTPIRDKIAISCM